MNGRRCPGVRSSGRSSSSKRGSTEPHAWRRQNGPPTPTTADDVPGGQMPGRAAGHAGQPGEADRRGGRGEGPAPRRSGSPWREALALPAKAQPARRVWIPKPGTDEQRPLGIPTMRDRAAQTLAELALEPEWEARFEPNSYGFRPGRSATMRSQAIFHGLCQKAKYVLDADIAKCFDRIDHQALLAEAADRPRLCGGPSGPGSKRGCWTAELFPTDGGHAARWGRLARCSPTSPCMASKRRSPPPSRATCDGSTRAVEADRRPLRRRLRGPASGPGDGGAVQQVAATWLADMGLELKPSKTRIHALRVTGLTSSASTSGSTPWARPTRRDERGCRDRPACSASRPSSSPVTQAIHGHGGAPSGRPAPQGGSPGSPDSSAQPMHQGLDELLLDRLRQGHLPHDGLPAVREAPTLGPPPPSQ